MTLPGAPLPRISFLLRAFTAPSFRGEPWFNSRLEFTTRLYWQGRLAMAAGIEAVRKASRADSVIVWIPDYFCNEALEPLRTLPFKLKFYPIREDLTPDWSKIETRANHNHSVQVFILVHYFGIPNALADAKTFCDHHRMILLEDGAHLLRPHAGLAEGDLLVFSPRKLLAIPSGGILVLPRHLEVHIEDSCRYPKANDVLPWVSLRLVQMILQRCRVPYHYFRSHAFRDGGVDGSQIPNSPELFNCAPYTLNLMSVMEAELAGIIQKRRRNYLSLLEWLVGLEQARPLFFLDSEETCPYTFPLLVAEGVSEALAKLQSAGIPVSQWPLLPPEVRRHPSEHTVALQTYEHLLLLPIHQGLSLDQVKMMGRRLQKVLRG